MVFDPATSDSWREKVHFSLPPRMHSIRGRSRSRPLLYHVFFRWHCKFSKSRMRYWSCGRCTTALALQRTRSLWRTFHASHLLTYLFRRGTSSTKDRGRWFGKVAMLFGSFGVCPCAWRTLGWRRQYRDLIPILPDTMLHRWPTDRNAKAERYIC